MLNFEVENKTLSFEVESKILNFEVENIREWTLQWKALQTTLQ